MQTPTVTFHSAGAAWNTVNPQPSSPVPQAMVDAHPVVPDTVSPQDFAVGASENEGSQRAGKPEGGTVLHVPAQAFAALPTPVVQPQPQPPQHPANTPAAPGNLVLVSPTQTECDALCASISHVGQSLRADASSGYASFRNVSCGGVIGGIGEFLCWLPDMAQKCCASELCKCLADCCVAGGNVCCAACEVCFKCLEYCCPSV